MSLTSETAHSGIESNCAEGMRSPADRFSGTQAKGLSVASSVVSAGSWLSMFMGQPSIWLLDRSISVICHRPASAFRLQVFGASVPMGALIIQKGGRQPA